ncbi:hypothetical protein AV521_32015 [Streptomyces sp. IMTB 2501]|nr:hypothetical protein AV521_32015 [Streptomyces sp. IMTB 2501]
MGRSPFVAVLPPSRGGGTAGDDSRRCDHMGTVCGLFDVLDFLHRAGPPSAHAAIDDPELIDRRGGGPYDWNSPA